MARVNVFLVHGFLGRPQDWMPIKRHLTTLTNVACYTPDLFQNEHLSPQHSFGEWTQNFHRWVQSFSRPQDRNIIVGYSMGGRLALHAFEKDPMFWDRVVVVSANPGFDDANLNMETPQRQARWIHDTYWADKFMKGDWEVLIRDWNSQGVFHGGGLEPKRDEKNYSREVLGLALTRWSLSLQKNLRPLIWRESKDVHWVVGENDEKYREIAEEMKVAHPDLKLSVVPNSGHRILFDSPQFLTDLITDLISELQQSTLQPR